MTLYDEVGGVIGLRALAAAWHTRVMADEVVSHAFQGAVRPDHADRLAAYWGEALGGPAAYTGTYGDESSVVAMHSGHGSHVETDDRAVACFDAALGDVGIDGELGTVLHDYFAWATSEQMTRWSSSAEDVPADLVLPRWSRDGLVP